jgi:signal transduction histidine kinase
MRGLYLRIASGVAIAAVVGWFAVGLFIPSLSSMLEQGLGDQLGSGPRLLARWLDETPREQWPELLARARRDLAIPLEIQAANALPTEVVPRVSRTQPSFVHGRLANLSLYIPLGEGSYFLVAGPLHPPPAGPMIVLPAVFVLVLTLTTSLAVGIPLVRRLRRLRSAITELGNGNWNVHLDPREGSLGELAASVNRTASRLRLQFEERETLLQAVSHEIGTPLSRMRFQVELLENVVPQEQRARLVALNENLDELDELGTELLGWMETDARTQLRPFDGGECLDALIELERLRIAGPVEMVLVAAGGVTIEADRRQFERAIDNLLRNASRYAQRRIDVVLKAADGKAIVEVHDDGPGIPREQWARVLEPFVRLEEPRSGAHRGLGLGLAIVRRIVERHGGQIDVESAKGGGTTIRTTWPCVG